MERHMRTLWLWQHKSFRQNFFPYFQSRCWVLWLFYFFLSLVKKRFGRQTDVHVCLVNLWHFFCPNAKMCHISDLFFELIYVRNSWKLAAVTGWITELLPLISVYTKNCSVIQSLNDTDSINSTLPSVKMRGVHCRKLSFCIISSLDLFFFAHLHVSKIICIDEFWLFQLGEGFERSIYSFTLFTWFFCFGFVIYFVFVFIFVSIFFICVLKTSSFLC